MLIYKNPEYSSGSKSSKRDQCSPTWIVRFRLDNTTVFLRLSLPCGVQKGLFGGFCIPIRTKGAYGHTNITMPYEMGRGTSHL